DGILRPRGPQSRHVNSSIGRTERPEFWERRDRHPRTRSVSKADDGEVRQPVTALPLVDAEPLEALVEIDGQARPSAPPVPRHEHADASRLAIALDGEGLGP